MQITRNPALEELLLQQIVDSYDLDILPQYVLEAEPKRGNEIHLSDLMSPLQAFWKRRLPEPPTTREAQLFMYGRGFEVEMVRRSGLVPGVSRTKHGISYRPDFTEWPGVFKGPIELKWRRANLAMSGEEPVEYDSYIPQIRGYSSLGDPEWGSQAILLVNTPRQGQSAADQFAATQPAMGVYQISFTDEELRAWEEELIRRKEALEALLAGRGKLRSLPLCASWKCGKLVRTTKAFCVECDKELVGQWETKHTATKVGAGHTVTPPEFKYEAQCPWYVFCRPYEVDPTRQARQA